VLLYRPPGDAEFQVLDNRDTAIHPLGRRRDLLPELLFDSETAWARDSSGQWVGVSPDAHLKHWRLSLRRWQHQHPHATVPGAARADTETAAVTNPSPWKAKL
jgi:hypothetical protein